VKPLGGRAEPRIGGGLEQFVYYTRNPPEVRQYHADALVANPFGVVALLRKRPGITLHNHRQPHGHRLADAARPRFADEVIRELHVARHFLGEAFDEDRRLARKHPQPRRKLLVVAADQQKLPVRQAPGDLEHFRRALAAEKNQPHRQLRIESQTGTRLRALRRPERLHLVEPRVQDHARNAVHFAFRVAQGQRLFHGLVRPADEMLILPLHPEVRRVIRKIGEDGHQRRTGQHALQALAQRAVEIGDQRHHHVRPAFPPELFEHPHLRPVKHADHQVHAGRELSRPERPALLQHEVVNVFEPQAGDLAEDVERIEQLLQIHHADLEGALLPLHHLLQGVGRRAMSAAGVEEDEVELLHQSDCATRHKCRGKNHIDSRMFLVDVTATIP